MARDKIVDISLHMTVKDLDLRKLIKLDGTLLDLIREEYTISDIAGIILELKDKKGDRRSSVIIGPREEDGTVPIAIFGDEELALKIKKLLERTD